jgi:hypothetical protein
VRREQGRGIYGFLLALNSCDASGRYLLVLDQVVQWDSFTGGNESEPEPDVCSDDLQLCTALKSAGAAGKRPEELMSIGGSIFLIAVGLVLALAVNVSVSGIDLQLVGWILALVGALGLLLSLVFYRRRRSVVVESPTAVPDDYPRRYWSSR